MGKIKTLPLVCAVMLIAFMFGGCSGKNSGANTENSPPASDAAAGAQTPPEAAKAADTGGYEEGTSPADSIVSTTPAEKVILVVSFGTSYNQSRSLTIGGIEAAIKDAYPDYQVRRAFSSQIIIDKLAQREGLNIDSVTEAMNRLVADNVKEVIIQPTTVMSGFEYDDIINEAAPFADKFESLKIGKNLLGDDADYNEVAEILVSETSKFRADGTAIVFMGHGTEHESNAAYAKLQKVLWDKGYADYIIGTVEAEPTIYDVIETLKAKNVKKAVLRPLMIVAGDHANNDMAGDGDDSWKTVLTEKGYAVETVVEGLGQIGDIQKIYIKHIRDAMNTSGLKAEISAAKTAAVSAARLKNGVYPVEVGTDSSMFRITDCLLTAKDGSMTALITLSGQGFDALYLGSAGEAEADGGANSIRFALTDEKRTFTVPVSVLDADMQCAALGVKSGTWYDHAIVFKSAGIPDDAFKRCEIDVTMTGGSGKASVLSPAALIRRDGTDYAEIVWSSPNYTYMIVGGEKYLPINTDGNSVFEIPVALDYNMTVTACTVAMSTPKEIEYTLNFDSSSVK